MFWHCVFSLVVVSEEWERLYCKYVDLHKAVNLEKPGNNHKAKALWLMRDAKTNGEAYYGRRSERQLRVEPQCEKRCGRRMRHMGRVVYDRPNTNSGVAVSCPAVPEGFVRPVRFLALAVSLGKGTHFLQVPIIHDSAEDGGAAPSGEM